MKKRGQRTSKKKKCSSLKANGSKKRSQSCSLKANSDRKIDQCISVEVDLLEEVNDLDKVADEQAEAQKTDRDQRRKLIANIFAYRKKLKSISAGHHAKVYGVFAKLYRVGVKLADDPTSFSSLMLSRGVTDKLPDRPKRFGGVELIVYVVRCGFYGDGKAAQKFASKYASIAEFFADQGIRPKAVVSLLERHRVGGLLEMSAQRRHEKRMLTNAFMRQNLPIPALRDFDQTDIEQKYKDTRKRKAILIEGKDEDAGDTDIDVHGKDAPPCSPFVPSRSLTILLNKEQLNTLRSVAEGRHATLVVQANKDATRSTFKCTSVVDYDGIKLR